MLPRIGSVLAALFALAQTLPVDVRQSPEDARPSTARLIPVVVPPDCKPTPCVELLFAGICEVVIPNFDSPDRVRVVLPNLEAGMKYEKNASEKVTVVGHLPYVILPKGIEPDNSLKCVTRLDGLWECHLDLPAPKIRFLVDGNDAFRNDPVHYAADGGKESIRNHFVFAEQLTKAANIHSKYSLGSSKGDVKAYFESASGALRAVDYTTNPNLLWGWYGSTSPDNPPPTQPAGALEIELGLSKQQGTLKIDGTKVEIPYNAHSVIQLVIENAPAVMRDMQSPDKNDYDFGLHGLVLAPVRNSLPIPYPQSGGAFTLKWGGPDCIPVLFAY